MKSITNKAIAALLAGLLVYSCAGAMEISTLFRLNMDGEIEADGITYSGDSGYMPVPVTVGEDEYGNPPDFTSNPGLVYMNGKSSNPDALDEVILVNVGAGYDLEQSYMFEAWISPDYANWPTAQDNRHSQIWIFKWWEIGDWCDVQNTISDNIGLAIHPDGYQQRVQAAGMSTFYNSAGDPNQAIAYEEFTHVGLVWDWDSSASLGKMSYYVNGELKLSQSTGEIVPGSGMPEYFGIGNHCFTAMDNEDELACGADVNFNGGFSGWFDSVAVSTFTGEFEGAHSFVLLEPQYCGDLGTEFHPVDFNKDCKVDLLDFAIYAQMWLDSQI